MKNINNITTFIFMLIVVLGVGYIIEFITYSLFILLKWDKFNWWNIGKLAFYLVVTCGLFFQDYFKKKVK